jgi:deoxyribose-phosphate aldolase
VSLIWEDAWEVLDEHFRRAAESLSAEHPTLSWSCGHSDNEAFPFRAYASFSGGTDETDVVISFDVLRKGDELLYSADIALEDGRVLANGPTGAVTMTGDLAAVRDQIETAVRAAAAFVDESRGLLGEQIRQTPA